MSGADFFKKENVTPQLTDRLDKIRDEDWPFILLLWKLQEKNGEHERLRQQV